ncbi:MAG: methyl-accepting chemotaxis protein [Betaproteobacteria bacterium]|nr:methyl-accepting chemotaxis protein [Betaproteobacteria bacterium]
MSIANKLYALIGALLALAAGVSGLGLYGMKSMVAGLETVYHDRVVPLRDLKDIADAYAVDIVDNTHKVRNRNLNPQEGLANVEKAEKLIAQRWKAYLATVLVEEEKKLVAEVEPRMKAGNEATAKLKNLLREGRIDDVAAFAASELYPAIDPVSESFSKLVLVQLDVAKREYEGGQRTYAMLRNLAVLLIAIGVAGGFGVAIWVIRSAVLFPLAQAQQFASQVAAGNLSAKVSEVRADEIGLLLRELGGMRDGLRRMVTGLKQNAEGVAGAAQQLAAASGEVAKTTSRQSDAASSMAAAVEELTVSISHVADSAREAHSVTARTGELSQAGSGVIQDTVAEMKRISHTVGEAANTIQAMGESSQKISGIVQVIKEVAEQTNLLALNAAIEAARAGEQGRGFAVVADEVRKLAERTAQATTEISDMIGAVQNNALAAVATMQEAVTRVEGGVELAQKASDSMVDIRDGAQRVVASVNDISNALKEQSIASNDIASSVERIAQMSEGSSAATRETADTARRLEDLAASTRAAVAAFQL